MFYIIVSLDVSSLQSTEDVLISQLLDPNNESTSLIEDNSIRVRDISSSAQLSGESPPFHSTPSPFREEEVERALKTS